MTELPLNIEYWASLYDVYTDYAEQYDNAMEQDNLVDRAEHLWDWKGLNRSIDFEDIAPVIEDLDQDAVLAFDQQGAIETVSQRLIDDGVVASKSLVTSAFLLHLIASGPDQYSAKFPIYDRRVWNAYVYLCRIRESGEQLYTQASQSSSKYGEFCRAFGRSCPDGRERDYERALFMFGGFIMDLTPNDSQTPIAKIDKVLQRQEEALINMQQSSGYASVDLTNIRGSE